MLSWNLEGAGRKIKFESNNFIIEYHRNYGMEENLTDLVQSSAVVNLSKSTDVLEVSLIPSDHIHTIYLVVA